MFLVDLSVAILRLLLFSVNPLQQVPHLHSLLEGRAAKTLLVRRTHNPVIKPRRFTLKSAGRIFILRANSSFNSDKELHSC